LSSRILVRGAFAEQDVRPYPRFKLTDLSSLLPDSVSNEEHTSSSSEEVQDRVEREPMSEVPDNAPPSLEELLASAQQQAEAIINFAQQEAEKLRQEAYAQGLASGREAGREQAKQEFLPALIAFAQIGQSLIVLEEQLIERFTPQLVRLSLDVAEKVIGKSVAEDPLIITSILERAREELPQARSIRIWLHPLDHQVLTECRPDLVRVGEKGGRTVEVVSSEEIERGGCRVETEMGVVDATIPVQLEEIRRQMVE